MRLCADLNTNYLAGASGSVIQLSFVPGKCFVTMRWVRVKVHRWIEWENAIRWYPLYIMWVMYGGPYDTPESR